MDPYIWDKSIKIKTKEGKYETEEKPKVKVKEKKDVYSKRFNNDGNR
jgi:hypothetical protein